MSDEWATDIDWDAHSAMYEDLWEFVEQKTEEHDLHPEQAAMLLNSLTGTYKGKAENRTWSAAQYRLQKMLWEDIREVTEDDEYDLDWVNVSFALRNLYEMSDSYAKRDMEEGDD